MLQILQFIQKFKDFFCLHIFHTVCGFVKPVGWHRHQRLKISNPLYYSKIQILFNGKLFFNFHIIYFYQIFLCEWKKKIESQPVLILIYFEMFLLVLEFDIGKWRERGFLSEIIVNILTTCCQFWHLVMKFSNRLGRKQLFFNFAEFCFRSTNFLWLALDIITINPKHSCSSGQFWENKHY